MKKKILIGCGIFFLIIVIAFTCLIVWFANMIDDSLSKKEIFELVNENYTLIIDDINENDFTDTEKLKGVKEVYYYILDELKAAVEGIIFTEAATSEEDEVIIVNK